MSHILDGKYQRELQSNGLFRVIVWVLFPTQKSVKAVDLTEKESSDLCERLTRKADEIKTEKQLTLLTD